MHRRKRRGEERSREGLRQVIKRAEERSGEEQRGWKTNA